MKPNCPVMRAVHQSFLQHHLINTLYFWIQLQDETPLSLSVPNTHTPNLTARVKENGQHHKASSQTNVGNIAPKSPLVSSCDKRMRGHWTADSAWDPVQKMNPVYNYWIRASQWLDVNKKPFQLVNFIQTSCLQMRARLEAEETDSDGN